MKKILIIAILLISTMAFAADKDNESIDKRIDYLKNQKALIQIKADAKKEYIDSEIVELLKAKKQLKAIKEKEKKKGNVK